MSEAEEALEYLIVSLERRYRGTTAKQFERSVSPAMADAFVRGWIAVGRNRLDIPSEWQGLADSFAGLG